MATLNHRLDIELTAAVQNLTLDTADNYSLYELTTNGSIVIAGKSTITSTGTTPKGVTFNFKYTGRINGGDLEFFGTKLPDAFKTKNCFITAYWNGSKFELTFTPDFSQDAIVTLDNLVDSNYGQHVIGGMFSPAITSSSLATEQNLKSLTIPANIRNLKGYRIIASGELASSPTAKTLNLETTTGVNTHVLANTGAVAYEGFFTLSSDIRLILPGQYVTHSTLMVGDGTLKKFYTNGSNWDTTLDQVLDFKITEATATGNLVKLDTLTVEKITK